MASLGEMISKVRSSFKMINSDDLITNRVVAAELKSAALMLIKRETDKRKLFSSDNIFTTIDCLEMEEVPLSECCSYTSPCNIARSKKQLPRIAENIYGYLIQGVFSVQPNTKFDYADPTRYVDLLKLYPNKKLTFFWIKNNYLYITDPLIEVVRLTAYFETDPDKSLFSCDGVVPDCPMNPMDEEFKCPGYLESAVLGMVRDTLLKTYKQSMDDKTPDDNDTSK